MKINDFVLLNNGIKMPIFGFGTYQIKNRDVMRKCLDCALEHGYRVIDTASVYKNEIHIGEFLPELLKKHNLSRQDVFITTKLSPKDLGRDETRKAIQDSLTKLKLDYVDLYLIHWPGKQGLRREDMKNAVFRAESWKSLEDVYTETNQLRSIGVSNYTVKHLEELLSNCCIVPAVLQSEFHPDYQQNDIVELCKQKNIHFTSYSSLGQGRLVEDSRLLPYAEKYGKNVPQILLRWALQKGCSVIPKSCDTSRIVENSDIFDFTLTASDMGEIGNLGKCMKYAWNADDVA
ncbi:glyoxal reductase-like [Styela clava]|uniref:glyoxal reductase-like n=1 Tax=Styela clava TaxID=7725 RepID=UPI001939B2AE|nr:glyoxal reductase-like [Styela clava]